MTEPVSLRMEDTALYDRVLGALTWRGTPSGRMPDDWDHAKAKRVLAALGLSDMEAAVERAAAVLHEHDQGRAPLPDDLASAYDVVYREGARAALAAALTPTEGED